MVRAASITLKTNIVDAAVRELKITADPVEHILKARQLVVLDGALATELERRGAVLSDPLWSAKCLLEQPDLIRAIHLDYFCAGADIATTATYQATFEGFARRGITAEEAARLMRSAVTLALQARDEFWEASSRALNRPRPLVAASVGPYGAMLADGSEYRGRYALDDRALTDFHRPRFDLLAESGADLLAFETIPCLREALVLAEMLRNHREMHAWMSFSCRDGQHNSEGEDIGEVVAELQDHPQIAAVGVNCTRPEFITPLLRSMRTRTDKPLLVYPNSGECYDAAAKTWTGSPDSLPFGELASLWYAEGARMIGGCCRTTPADIRGVLDCVAHNQRA